MTTKNTKEAVRTTLLGHLNANGFSICCRVKDDRAALCLEKIGDARLQVKLMKKGVVVEVYADENGEKVWNEVGKKLARTIPPNGCAFEELGKQVLKNEFRNGGALIIRYATGIDWQDHELSNAEKLKICEAAKELLCRIV